MILITRIKHISNNTVIAERCTCIRTVKNIETFKKHYRKKNQLPDNMPLDVEYKELTRKN